MIVGAYGFDNGETDEGAAFVFLGCGGVPNGLPANAHALLESNQVGAVLGYQRRLAGDVNGDGYADVIVGALLYDNPDARPQADEGAAFVYLGSASGVADGSPASAHALLESDQAARSWARASRTAGDVNGDGYADVIVGAPTLRQRRRRRRGRGLRLSWAARGGADGNPARLDAPRAIRPSAPRRLASPRRATSTATATRT